MSVDVERDHAGDTDLRQQAIERLQNKREFKTHLLVYTLVNAFLVILWINTGNAFFWPIFPIMGWGIGLAAHAFEVYAPQPSEQRIEREMRRFR